MLTVHVRHCRRRHDCAQNSRPFAFHQNVYKILHYSPYGMGCSLNTKPQLIFRAAVCCADVIRTRIRSPAFTGIFEDTNGTGGVKGAGVLKLPIPMIEKLPHAIRLPICTSNCISFDELTPS